MKHLTLLAVSLLLAACASPGLDFVGRAPVKVAVDGSDFSVWHDRVHAQAIRTNVERRRGVMERGHRAIELATGCAIRPGTFQGDGALFEAGLTCPGAPVTRQ